MHINAAFFFFLSRTIRMNPKDEVYSDFFTKIMNREYPFPPSFILHKFGFITELYFWDLTQQHCIVYLGNNYFFLERTRTIIMFSRCIIPGQVCKLHSCPFPLTNAVVDMQNQPTLLISTGVKPFQTEPFVLIRQKSPQVWATFIIRGKWHGNQTLQVNNRALETAKDAFWF